MSLLNRSKNVFRAIHVLVMVSRMEKSNLSIILSSVKSSSCSDTQSFSRYFLVYSYFYCVLQFAMLVLWCSTSPSSLMVLGLKDLHALSSDIGLDDFLGLVEPKVQGNPESNKFSVLPVSSIQKS